MNDKIILAGELMDETSAVSIIEVCQICHISEDVFLEMIEHGLFKHQSMHLKTIHVDYKTLGRIQSVCRIQHDLGINLPGAVLVLELLDELEQVRNELSILQHHVTLRPWDE